MLKLKEQVVSLLKNEINKKVNENTISVIYTYHNCAYTQKTALKDEFGKSLKEDILKKGKLVSKIVYKKDKIEHFKYGLGILGTDFLLILTDDIVTKKNGRGIFMRGNKPFIGKTGKLQEDEKYISKILENLIVNKQDLPIQEINNNVRFSYVLKDLGINISIINKKPFDFSQVVDTFGQKDCYNIFGYYKGKERIKDMDNSFVLVNDCLEKALNENGIKFNDNVIDFTSGFREYGLLKQKENTSNLFFYSFS